MKHEPGKSFRALAHIATLLIAVTACARQSKTAEEPESVVEEPSPTTALGRSIADRMLHHRAVDAAVWAMPLMSFKFFRDGAARAGVGPNDVGYFSKIQDWRMQAATPNNTTPYIFAHWTIKHGPIVIEIPPSTPDVGIFGTIMDAWQRPLDDVGAAGRDRGRGAR